MAITTTFPEPFPPDHITLPWRNGGHPVTQLDRRSAAVTSWLNTISESGVIGFAGEVPPKIMHEILRRLQREDLG